jgi:inner membrane protein
MLLPNHIVGGFVITGTAAALCGENIMHSEFNLVCVVFFSILADIDNPKSPVSWLCRPLSKFIFENYGHRTVTHSFGALAFVILFTFVLGRFTPLSISPLICGLAYFSHLFLDMMTVQGVPLFYPIRRPVVLPDNPRHRFRTGDSKTEVMLFGIFSGLCLFLNPLMTDGFWTTYNRSFGTPKTLYSEFIKSNDLLEATYVIQKGSTIDTGRGFVIDADNADRFTLMRNDSSFQFDATKQIIKSVIPTHTKKKFYFEQTNFISISADSLNNLLRGKLVFDIEANSNEPFIVSEKGIPNKTLSAKFHFPNKLLIRALDSLPQKDELFAETDFASMSIRNDLRKLDEEFNFRNAEFQRHADSILIYDNLAMQELDLRKKDRFQKRRDALRLEEKPQFDNVTKNALNAALRISEARFVVDNQRRIFERERSYAAIVRSKPPTAFVGFVKYIRIE